MFAQYSGILIPLLAGLAVVLIGAALLVGRLARQAPLQARLRQIQGGTSTVGVAPAGGLGHLLERLGTTFTAPRETRTLKQELTAAGFNSRAAPTLYMGTKVVLFFIGLPVLTAATMFTGLPGMSRFVLVAAGALALCFVPNLYVAHWRARRRQDIQAHLPDAIDLLEISVSAGLGLDQAWNSVSGEIRTVSAVLADEMALTNLEMHLGSSRTAALRHMAQRTGAEDLSSLVAILVESERFGTSTGDALRTFAGSLREIRSLRAQEHAEKMAVKMLFPLVMFIFPPVLIIVAGPAIVTIVKTLSFGK